MNLTRIGHTVGIDWASEEGQTLPLLMLVMVMAVLAGTIVIDFGALYASRAKAHAAADLAAVAAVQDLPDTTEAKKTAVIWAKRNGFDAAAKDVEVTVETTSAPCAHANSCVRVTIKRDFKWTFGRLFGLASASAKSSAVAERVADVTLVRDVLLILDRSPSLSIDWTVYGPKLYALAESPSLTGADRLGLVTFPQNGPGGPCGSCLKLPLTSDFAQPHDSFHDALQSLLSSSSGSNAAPALNAARAELDPHAAHARAGATRSIILMTDGKFTGSSSDVDASVASIAAAGIRIDVVAIGDVKAQEENVLVDIASQTGGAYYAATHNALEVQAQLEAIVGTIVITR